MNKKVDENDWKSVKEVASILEVDKSYCLKWLKSNDFVLHIRRTQESRGQRTCFLTSEDAERAIQLREEQGYAIGGEAGKIIGQLHGFFYICQLVPELDPKRIKLGFAVDLANRLTSYKTSNPTATYLRNWGCRKSWEQTVIDLLTYKTCLLIAGEVFECQNIEALIRKGDQLFAMLPDPDVVSSLAVCSPFNGNNK